MVLSPKMVCLLFKTDLILEIQFLTNSGLRWFRQRRLITPAFHFKILNEFHPIMSSNVDRLVSKLYTFADSGKSFDAQHIINLATLDVICGNYFRIIVNAFIILTIISI